MKFTRWSGVTDFLRVKKSYKETFEGKAGELVLKDLARVCAPSKSAFDENDRVHAFNEGKRVVWLRIQKMLNMTEEDVYNAAKETEDV